MSGERARTRPKTSHGRVPQPYVYPSRRRYVCRRHRGETGPAAQIRVPTCGSTYARAPCRAAGWACRWGGGVTAQRWRMTLSQTRVLLTPSGTGNMCPRCRRRRRMIPAVGAGARPGEPGRRTARHHGSHRTARDHGGGLSRHRLRKDVGHSPPGRVAARNGHLRLTYWRRAETMKQPNSTARTCTKATSGSEKTSCSASSTSAARSFGISISRPPRMCPWPS